MRHGDVNVPVFSYNSNPVGVTPSTPAPHYSCQVYLLWLHYFLLFFSVFFSVSVFVPVFLLPGGGKRQLDTSHLFELPHLIFLSFLPHLYSPPVIVSCSAVVTERLTGHCFPLYQEPLCPTLSLQFMWHRINRPQTYCHQALWVCPVTPICPNNHLSMFSRRITSFLSQ